MTMEPPASPAALDDYLQQGEAAAEPTDLQLPLADELHVECWAAYVDEARTRGAAATLSAHLAQLRFPIEHGISERADYRAATRKLDGRFPPIAPGFADPEGIQLSLQPTAAGQVPVIRARHRADFEHLVRALGHRNEPVSVPASLGACIIGGLVNVDRLARHRDAHHARGGSDQEWPAAQRAFIADKRNYQDRVILLSEGPYAGVPAAEIGMADAAWQARSAVLRAAHECTHYLTARVLGSMRNALLDELAADFAGLLAAFGHYDEATAQRILGVHAALPGPYARLRLYLGDPPLPESAVEQLAHLAREATRVLARFAQAEHPQHTPMGTELAVLALFATPLQRLLDPSGEAELTDRYQRLLAAQAPAPAACRQ